MCELEVKGIQRQEKERKGKKEKESEEREGEERTDKTSQYYLRFEHFDT
jgi:hypothetical protein